MIYVKIWNALFSKLKKDDNISMERLERNRVRATIEKYCEEKLKNTEDLFVFEALPTALDATLEVLEGEKFQEKYEFSQVDDTCFMVRMKELDIF